MAVFQVPGELALAGFPSVSFPHMFRKKKLWGINGATLLQGNANH